MGYNFLADFLTKFSNLTPWVQVMLGAIFCLMEFGICFLLLGILVIIAGAFRRGNNN